MIARIGLFIERVSYAFDPNRELRSLVTDWERHNQELARWIAERKEQP